MITQTPDWKAISKIQKWKKKDFDKLLADYLKNKTEVYTKIKSFKKEERTFVILGKIKK